MQEICIVVYALHLWLAIAPHSLLLHLSYSPILYTWSKLSSQLPFLIAIIGCIPEVDMFIPPQQIDLKPCKIFFMYWFICIIPFSSYGLLFLSHISEDKTDSPTYLGDAFYHFGYYGWYLAEFFHFCFPVDILLI